MHFLALAAHMCHSVSQVKTITIRELHSETGRWVRAAARHGEILVTHHGKPVAKLVPEAEPPEIPYFARRKFIRPSIKGAIESGRLGAGGTDSTTSISEDRDARD
jgi:prevent-host-death family protein